jgi:hypothetical protein
MKTLATKIRLSAIAFFLVTSFVCQSQEYDLGYNLKKGDVFTRHQKSDMDITTGQDMNMKTVVEMTDRYEVTEVQGNLFTLTFRYENIKMEMNNPLGGTITIDSDAPSEGVVTSANLSPLFKAIIGIPITFKIDRQGKVQEVKGYDKLLEAMTNSFGDNPDQAAMRQVLAQLGQQFNAESLKSSFEVVSYPGRRVKAGDSWTNRTTASGPFSFETDTRLTLTGVSGNTATIEAEGSGKVSFDTQAGTSPGSEVKTSLNMTQKVSIRTNLSTGWPSKVEITQEIEGEVEAGGMKIPMTIKGKTTVD